MSSPDSLVRKPWGFEYPIFQTDDVAVWLLHIEEGKSTSLHCHPSKNTGFLLLAGQARISFLADSKVISAPAKEMFRRGLFHRTTALSKGGIWLLEAENPNNKPDLVRLQDDHGREKEGYEGSEYHEDLEETFIQLVPPFASPVDFQTEHFSFRVETVPSLDFFSQDDEERILLFLSGGIGKIVDGRELLATVPGDVGSMRIVSQVARNMDFVKKETLLLSVACGQEI